MPLEMLVPMIKYWLVKNISQRPQIIRSKDIKNGMQVMNPGEQLWVNCAVHQQVMDCEWCDTITNDLEYEETIGTGKVDIQFDSQVEVPLPVEKEVISLRVEDRAEGILPGANNDTQQLPDDFTKVGVKAYDGVNEDAGDADKADKADVQVIKVNAESEAENVITAGRPLCAGIKADGVRCGRHADVGSDYCYIHKPND